MPNRCAIQIEMASTSYESPKENTLQHRPRRFNIVRGLIAGLVASALAFAVPWLLLSVLFLTTWQGSGVRPSPDVAWLMSYFLMAVVGTSACVSFGTTPSGSRCRDFVVVAFAMILVYALLFFPGRQRYKSEPEFGDIPSDIAWLTIPAIAIGIVILGWRALRVGQALKRTIRNHLQGR